MAWYRAGTVTVSSGSNVVTGTGTQWAGNVHVGDTIVLGSPPQLYEVANVASNTTIGLVTNYTGTSGSGQAYFIAPTQGWIKELADRAAAVIATYASIEQAIDDLELITTLISQADAQNGTRTDVQGWSSLRVRQAANAAITARAGSSANFGTAAMADLASSQYDTIARAANMSLGLYGLGSQSLGVLTLSQLNGINRSGFYALGTAIPNTLDVGSKIIHIEGSASSATQIGVRLNTNRMYLRSRSGSSSTGTWSNWDEILNTGNTLNIGATASSARAAIQSSVFPAHSKASMPSHATSLNMGVIVSDAVGGRRPFWSDGTNWRDSTGTILS